ncbi:MAG: sigma-70 family RNA polymerase sigma factor [Clostridia bacterium]|nr:sigma-70 family RNA polymerase sigma factor [Clostridia bacterium]
MDDRQITTALYEGKEEALSEVAGKYARLYKSILRETLNNESDVEECANDCLLAVWNSIPPNRPDDLGAYVCKIARRIGINRYHYNTRQKRNDGYTLLLSELEDAIPDTGDPFASSEEPEKPGERLSAFIQALDGETRILFIRRYFYMESVKELAARFAMRENIISVKLHRARKRLKRFLEKENGYHG